MPCPLNPISGFVTASIVQTGRTLQTQQLAAVLLSHASTFGSTYWPPLLPVSPTTDGWSQTQIAPHALQPLQADEPLSTSLPLLADSGPLGLPFKALVRQALPSIDRSPVVSVDGRAGGVMLGASGRTDVTISNAGVLPMLYSIKVGWVVVRHCQQSSSRARDLPSKGP